MPRLRDPRAAAALLAAALLLAPTPPACAATAQERIFALALLDAVATGDRLVYDHTRSLTVASEHLPAIAGGRVEIAILEDAAGRREARVALIDGPRVRRLTPFPADGGHPLLMVFMETAVHGMAALTGGSPAYIRNRMREALRTQGAAAPVRLRYAGDAVAGERFSFRPFRDDPNRDRMGPFADLEIAFVISAAVPGAYAALSLRTGAPDGAPDGAPMLSETMILRGVRLAD